VFQFGDYAAIANFGKLAAPEISRDARETLNQEQRVPESVLDRQDISARKSCLWRRHRNDDI
jgi:hypothetical protein